MNTKLIVTISLLSLLGLIVSDCAGTTKDTCKASGTSTMNCCYVTSGTTNLCMSWTAGLGEFTVVSSGVTTSSSCSTTAPYGTCGSPVSSTCTSNKACCYIGFTSSGMSGGTCMPFVSGMPSSGSYSQSGVSGTISCSSQFAILSALVIALVMFLIL
jgi:hypothetical protein